MKVCIFCCVLISLIYWYFNIEYQPKSADIRWYYQWKNSPKLSIYKPIYLAELRQLVAQKAGLTVGDQAFFLTSVLQKHTFLLIFHATPVVRCGPLRQPLLQESRFCLYSILETSVSPRCSQCPAANHTPRKSDTSKKHASWPHFCPKK